MPEHDLDAAVEAAAKLDPAWEGLARGTENMQSLSSTRRMCSEKLDEIRAKTRAQLEAALPHLQDQGLRELAEWCARIEGKAEREANCCSPAPDERRLYCEGQAQAFRAVQTEIERRIGEGRDAQ